MRRPSILDIGLGVLVIGFGLFIAGQNSRFLAQVQPHTGSRTRKPITKRPEVHPAIPVQQPQGSPAIRPTHPSETPAFAVDDVRRYLNSTPGALVDSLKSKASISRIDCSLDAGKVSALLHGRNTGLPNDLRVCYVELSGTFNFYVPPSARSSRGSTLAFHSGFQVFDARTGNLVLAGAYNPQ
jgi:hypothetical protein